MKRDDLYDLAAFVVVAEQRSFTRAAVELGMSQSALSHAIKALEERLGVRLLSRTTRSVSATDAGERLLRSLVPALDEISSGVDAVGAMGSRPSGNVRVTATAHAIRSAVMPHLPAFFKSYPDVQLDMIVDDNLTDIVADRIDAGIRFGDIVEKDMIAVRISPDIRMAVVGSPAYFAESAAPASPRELSSHRCLNYRHIKTGGLYAWDFEEDGRPFEVRVEGPLVFSNSDLLRDAAIAGYGLAFVYEDQILADLEAGRLIRTLESWCPTFPGYYLYHTNRKQTPPALAALIDAIRYRTGANAALKRNV